LVQRAQDKNTYLPAYLHCKVTGYRHGKTIGSVLTCVHRPCQKTKNFLLHTKPKHLEIFTTPSRHDPSIFLFREHPSGYLVLIRQRRLARSCDAVCPPAQPPPNAIRVPLWSNSESLKLSLSLSTAQDYSCFDNLSEKDRLRRRTRAHGLFAGFFH